MPIGIISASALFQYQWKRAANVTLYIQLPEELWREGGEREFQIFILQFFLYLDCSTSIPQSSPNKCPKLNIAFSSLSHTKKQYLALHCLNISQANCHLPHCQDKEFVVKVNSKLLPPSWIAEVTVWALVLLSCFQV